jgi:Cd2+/Zn2+-exporting ATPase
MSCENRSAANLFEENNGKSIWIIFAFSLGLTVILAGLLDILVNGLPLGFPVPLLNKPATVSMAIYYTAVIGTGVYVGVLGLEELLKEKRFSVEFLMSVAAFGAAYLGFLFEAATVLFLYSLAEYFEGYIEDKARKTIEKLSKLIPDEVTIIVGSSEKTVMAKEVEPGATMIVRPGERIALDGTIIEGDVFVDQSLVTGESNPIEKKTGDCVYAGTLDTNGVLKIIVTKGSQSTLFSRIVHLVIESRKRKASIERLVDRLARIYVPLVIAIAAFTALVVPRLFGGSYEMWVYRSLILLVISCPSAFVVSIPATIFMAVTIAARKGVLIKGGVYIEQMARIKCVIFDKTGTLTFGKPFLHDISSVEKSDQQVLTYAAALEQFSNHPLANTILQKADEYGLQYGDLEVKNVKEVPGKGVIGHVNGMHVAVGNMELMKEQGCECEQIREIYEKEEHTAVCVSLNKSTVASFCVRDQLRKDAAKTVKSLRRNSIHTVMLTGDKKEIAQQVANELGIDEVHSGLFPEDKLRLLKQLEAKYGIVSMVGDGVNDAPALAASDVGMAMGGSQVDAALDSADVVLVKDELVQIPYLIRLSRKTMGVARQNIVASLVVKIALGTLGLLGFIPLWFTVASGDDGVTMLLLLNTLRLANVDS